MSNIVRETSERETEESQREREDMEGEEERAEERETMLLQKMRQAQSFQIAQTRSHRRSEGLQKAITRSPRYPTCATVLTDCPR